jgi:hypothetical protein
MKTKEELLELRSLYSKRMDEAKKLAEKFSGKVGEQEWIIQFHMARGKVLLLDYLIEEEET